MENTGIDFTNSISNAAGFNIFNYRNFYNGGGCAIGDINNDGLADVFFTANMGPNKLYLNKGNFQFEDISEKAGIREELKWSTGVVMADINNDGWLDIYVCNAGYQKGRDQDNALFINNHDLSFTDKAAEYGLADAGYTTHAAFFDYDLDGDLDAYILNNSFIPVNTLNYANKRDLRAEDWPVADFLKGGGDKLLRNDNGKFTDVSKAANIYGSLIGFGLGVTVGDINGDRYPDIYVSNDFFERDYLYINQRDGTFREELENRMQHISHSSMGADMADINNDDQADIFVTEMLPDDDARLKTTTTFENIDIQKLKQRSGFYNQFLQNTLQVSNGNGRFYETAFYSGVAASDWSWGGLIFDADNDGLNDIYVCNGIYNDVTDQDFIDFFANDVIQKMVLTGEKEEISQVINKMPSRPIPNKLFQNRGGLKFEDQAGAWGLAEPSFSNGAAYGDLDNDGDADLVVNNVNQPAFIYKNNSREQEQQNYIAFRLKGASPNLFAVGALVKLYAGGEVLSRELIPSRGFQSSVDYKLLFGLGKKQADSVQVIWPNLAMTTLLKPAINQVHELDIKTANTAWQAPAEAAATLFGPVDIPDMVQHQEDDYTDFYFERNIPVLLSRQGPRMAKADVNGDGLEDIYIGGAAGQAGQLYLQTARGFRMDEQPVFRTFKDQEDVAVLFFDADKDGDADLYIGAGGNQERAGEEQLAHRLYLNDGRGGFSYQVAAFPPNKMNISVAVPNDINGDGHLDLFIGGRSVPGNYGISPASFIMINDGKGRFRDQTATWLSGKGAPGMVTDAEWADLTGDGQNELILVGEWMAPAVYAIRGNRLEEMATPLQQMKGWWQSVTVADLDKDGKKDLVLGNTGSNFYLKGSTDQPVKLWMNDFDANGTIDKIMTRSIKGRDVPVFMKRELTDQLPVLKKQNLRHEQYAEKSIQDLFDENLLETAEVKQLNDGGSYIAWNEGGGKFSTQLLPVELQLSSINAALTGDLDGDALPDLVTAGNITDFQPQFGSIDAGYGHVLRNKGNREFVLVRDRQSGLLVKGMARDLSLVQTRSGSLLVVTCNNEKPLLYRLRKD